MATVMLHGFLGPVFLWKEVITTNTILLSSYVKLPANTTAQKIYDQLVLVAVVDQDTGKIEDVDCSMVTELAKNFLSRLLVGYNLNAGAEGLQKSLERWYFGHLKKALITAVKLLYIQFDEYKTKMEVAEKSS